MQTFREFVEKMNESFELKEKAALQRKEKLAQKSQKKPKNNK